MIFSTAYADAAPAAQSGGLASLLLPISLIIVFYFLLIRPQQKQRKQHQALIASLKKGDKVMTNSGLIATITKVVNDQEVLLEIANGVHCRFVKSAIINVVNADAQKTPQIANNNTPVEKEKVSNEKISDEKTDVESQSEVNQKTSTKEWYAYNI